MNAPDLPQLNFPKSTFKLKKDDAGRFLIFDESRKKYYVLTPEEWVRQNCLHFLWKHRSFPISLLAVEKEIILNGKQLRYDIAAYSKAGTPFLLVECKAPHVAIKQDVFDQITSYNIQLKVPYLLVTNGIEHYTCMIDYENGKYSFIKDIPIFTDFDK